MNKRALFGRVTAVLLMIALIFPSGFAAKKAKAESSAAGIIRATELVMREGAGTDYSKVCVDGDPVILKYGQEVTVLGESNGWYYLRAIYNGTLVTGYSLSKKGDVVYIEILDGKSVEGSYKKGTVIAGTVNVRKGPSTDYEKVLLNGESLVLKYGQEVKIIGEENDWYHLTAEVNGALIEGYCRGDFIEPGETVTFTEPEYSYGEIIATKLNVRKGPGTDHDIVKAGGADVTLSSGCKVTILGETDGWYHITAAFNGNIIEGYCLGKYVEVTEKPGKTGDDGKTDGGKTDDKPEDKPGDKTDDKPGDPAGDGDNTGDSGSDGPYVPTSPTDLSHGVPEGYELAETKYSAKYAIPAKVTAKTGLNLRGSAVEGAEIIAVLPYEKELTIINTKSVDVTASNGKTVSEKWYRVVADVDGAYMCGYVVSTYIEITDFTGVTAKTSYKNQIIHKKINKTTKLTYAKGKNIKLAKGTVVEITGDYTTKTGEKKFGVTVEYKDKTYNGYILASRLALVSTVSSYTVQYLVPAEPAEPDKPEDPDDDEDPEDIEPEKPGTATFDGANAVVRDAAGLAVRTSAKNSSEMLYTVDGKAVLLYTGDPVQIIDVTADNGKIWCYIRFYFNNMEYFGYIRSTHLESDVLMNLLSSETEASSAPLDFETKLEREGFPESYKPLLRELHAQYPLWEFKAYHTGIDWNEAVAAESEVGVSLLPNYYSLEWLSFEEGAYSWKTDKFTIFDGTYWVAASEDAVRYYMDPRNFLTYTGIFMFENLTYNPSIQTAEGAADILKTTVFGNGATYTYKDDFGETRKTSYVDTFLMAAEYSGVSLYHLVSRSKNEIGNGTPSNSVSGTVSGYEGLYNFYNVGANDSAIPGQNIRNGLEFAKKGRGSAAMNQLYLIPWSNPFRAILGGAFYLGYNYVNKGQDTLYFERFNVVSDGAYPVFTHQYMTNVAAACTESTSTSRGYDHAADMAIEFTIPVYLNMPEETCVAPEKAYNPNNWLKSLKVYDQNGTELPLTPTFDSSVKQSYSIIVDYSVSSVNIDAATVSKLAEITSGSRFDLEVGENLITVKVKAENGKVRKYKIYISREPDPDAPAQDDTDNTENTDNSDNNENAGNNEDPGETGNTGDEGTEAQNGNGDGTGSENGGESTGETGEGQPEDGSGETGEGTPDGGYDE